MEKVIGIGRNILKGKQVNKDVRLIVFPGTQAIYLEAIKRGIKDFAVKENKSLIDVDKNKLNLDGIIEVDTYKKCLEQIL